MNACYKNDEEKIDLPDASCIYIYRAPYHSNSPYSSSKWRVHVAGFRPSRSLIPGRWSRVGDVTVVMPLDFDSIETYSPYNHLRLLFFHYWQSRQVPGGGKAHSWGENGTTGPRGRNAWWSSWRNKASLSRRMRIKIRRSKESIRD